jgi:hypothetical protein
VRAEPAAIGKSRRNTRGVPGCETTTLLRERAVLNEPPVLQVGDAGDPLVVPVVMHERHACLLCRGSKQQVGRGDPAVVSSGSQKKLNLPRPVPESARHREELEGVQTLGSRTCSLLVRGEARQLEHHQIANQDPARLDLVVEPVGEMRESPVACPGPDAGIEECRAVERDRRGCLGRTQKRSRPSRTSSGVPEMSTRTSKPWSTRRRVASRSATFTVSLNPLVPSSRLAAASARSSTSTVVRVMRTILAHHDRRSSLLSRRGRGQLPIFL